MRRNYNQENNTGGKSAGMFFSAIIVSLIFISVVVNAIINVSVKSSNYESSNWYQYISYGVSSIAILATFFLGLKMTGQSFKACSETFRISKKFVLIVGLLFVGMMLGLSKVNLGLIWIFKKWGYQPPETQITQLNIVLVLLIVAILPAIFEELLFRGFILNGLKDLGQVKAVIFSALLFAFYHMSPAQTAYQFLVGLLFAFVALKAKSVLPTMILHFLNNAFIVLNEFYFQISFNLPLDIVLTILGLVCIAFAVYLLFKTKLEIDAENANTTTNTNIGKNEKLILEKRENEQKLFFVYGLPGIVIALIMWVAAFF